MKPATSCNQCITHAHSSRLAKHILVLLFAKFFIHSKLLFLKIFAIYLFLRGLSGDPTVATLIFLRRVFNDPTAPTLILPLYRRHMWQSHVDIRACRILVVFFWQKIHWLVFISKVESVQIVNKWLELNS